MKKHIHFVGIKGVGMTPLAIIAKEAGFEVTGSDIGDTFITDDALEKAGVTPFVGFDATHVEGADLVITTGAHGGYNNMEVTVAQDRKIPVWAQGQAVGEFMRGELFGRDYTGISVAGSHGKTTTTAMLATILMDAKMNPSYVVGTSSLIPLGLPGHYGKGDYFIAEADEYATELTYDKTPKFMWQKPRIAIITNVELDHTDLYPDIAAVDEAFLSFAKQLPPTGLLIVCGDTDGVKRLLTSYDGRKITYGFSPENDYVITRISISGGQTFFWVSFQGTSLGEFAISVAGEHNALNALAAAIAALETGLPLEQVKKSLRLFAGSKRRMERKGAMETGAIVYDDYAHHPTEIQKTLLALRKQFERKKILVVFQPHTYSRTKMLLEDFSRSFRDASSVILLPIYASLREAFDPSISSEHLADAIAKQHKEVLTLDSLASVVKYLNDLRPREDTVVVTMGAGDVYKLSDELHLKNA